MQRRRAHLEGVVQGVGFRPFVARLAAELGLAGFVGNDGEGVFVEVEGPAAAADAFARRLVAEAPAAALIEHVQWHDVTPTGGAGFEIRPSRTDQGHGVPVAADLATCDDCLRELRDPDDRRYRYPFVNCTACGPRFTIAIDVPYDRARTTMAGFTMCPACAAEFDDPTDRRFHAQPVCCPDCGPRLRLVDRDGQPVPGDPIAETAALLGRGAIVAVKGIGGYHLAVDATDEAATGRLRAAKHRDEKPFAVMVPDLDGARRLALVSDEEANLLTDPSRPIVLLSRRADAGVAASVAPGTATLGVLLPYTPLHHLLCAHHPGPFVLTSGNVADEPIAHEDDDALARLAGIADAWLTHDRPIHVRTDDSVARVVAGAPMLLRRSRGHAPRPLRLPLEAARPVLACGAELKHTFCLAEGRRAILSHHIGDLENWATHQAFTAGVEHFCRLFAVEPEVVAHDLHPEYLSTKHALALDGVELVGVQHHHAHVASCLVDNGRVEPVIGVAFDGLGYGTDGTLWGGEFLVADLRHAERVGHLAPIPLPGGATAVREPWRAAAAHLDAVLGGRPTPPVGLRERHRDEWDAVLAAAAARVNAPLTSSVGRLFDAVAAVAGLRDRVAYEGQAATELEAVVDPDEGGSFLAGIEDGTPVVVRAGELVLAAAEAVAEGTPPPTVAARFHNGVVRFVVDTCVLVRRRTGLSTVALSGGVFQNAVLLERVVPALADAGFEVLTHHRVPPNDGGISLGQAAVAAARDEAPPA